MGKEWEADMRIMIALAEAGWSRSFSWRVFGGGPGKCGSNIH